MLTTPMAVKILAGDFNHANLKTVLFQFEQYIQHATRGINTLDIVYSNIKNGYRATPIPHFGCSDQVFALHPSIHDPLGRKLNPLQRLSEHGLKVPPISCFLIVF